MLSVFEIFKIILGIAIAIVVIIIAMRFAETYIGIGEKGQWGTSLSNMRKTANDVYTTGITQEVNIEGGTENLVAYSPPNVLSSSGSWSYDYLPMLMVPGGKLAISREAYDLGWWKFYYLEALPETNVLFSPTDDTDVVWETVYSITDSFPSSEGLGTHIYFGFGCNATDSSYRFSDWDSEEFKGYIPYIRGTSISKNLKSCPEIEDMDYYITVSQDPETPFRQFLLVPKDEYSGYVYVNSSGAVNGYYYKTPMDVIALITTGEKGYHYMNRLFMANLKSAAAVRTKEFQLLYRKLGTQCPDLYGPLISELDRLGRFAGGNYSSPGDMAGFGESVLNSRYYYEKIQEGGCD